MYLRLSPDEESIKDIFVSFFDAECSIERIRNAEESGFDANKLLEQIQDPEVKAKLIANTEAAVEKGVFGIHTFFVGDEMFFGKDKLWEVEELLND